MQINFQNNGFFLIVDVSHSVWNIEVNIFSNNITNSLAKRQAFAHFCELLRSGENVFLSNLGMPKCMGKCLHL